MDRANKRRHERVETNIRVKLPGDTTWTECTTSNISGSGLFFEAARRLDVGIYVDFQFMIQSKSGTHTNVHFFASAQVVRVVAMPDSYQIAVEFTVAEDVLKEILQHVKMIKSQSLKLDRPTISDALFGKSESE